MRGRTPSFSPSPAFHRGLAVLTNENGLSASNSERLASTSVWRRSAGEDTSGEDELTVEGRMTLVVGHVACEDKETAMAGWLVDAIPRCGGGSLGRLAAAEAFAGQRKQISA